MPSTSEVTVDGVVYPTLTEALANIPAGGTVTLTEDTASVGYKAVSGSDFTIDLNGHGLLIENPTTGSPGTETSGFQLLKGSKVTLKNGVITSEVAKILVQNYCDLVLDNCKLIGTPTNLYVLSNNFGNVVLKNGTQIIAEGNNVAFDLYYGMSKTYDGGVSVTIADDSVVVKGRIEYGKADRADAALFAERCKLITPVGYVLEIPEGYEWVDNGDGTQILKAVA